MDIKKTKNGKALTCAIDGRVDTTTAPELESQLKEEFDDIDTLTLDFSAVEYISSAGLRVLLSAKKKKKKKGGMKIKGVSEAIMEIFEVTGFSDILTIE